MHLTADLRAQAVDDLVQGLRAGGVHVDEELELGLVCARRTRLDVGEVDALVLKGETETKQTVDKALHCIMQQGHLPVAAGVEQV